MNSPEAVVRTPIEEFVQTERTVCPAAGYKREVKTVTGLALWWTHLRLKATLLSIAVQCYRNPVDWIRALGFLVALRKQFLGDHRLQKMVYAGGKYYMGLYTPGWNSLVYRQFIASQLNDFKPVRLAVNRFNTVFMAITKKCALQCEHCYEWENLNKKDVLSAHSMRRILKKLQDRGVSQIQFSGGEPLLKMGTLLNVLQGAAPGTDFWVATSGFKLHAENAAALKAAGLTGVIISLDHFVPEKHNTFRGFKNAFYWVEQGVKNALDHQLVTALSLCATKDFISEGNLMAYMDVAKKLGVSFVQILEPKAVGHYAGQDVALGPQHFSTLEAFFEKINFNKAYAGYPIVTYHGYYQRRIGCFSAGVKGFYVDTNGDMNACPFCHRKSGNVLDEDFEGNLKAMVTGGCHSHPTKMN